MTPGQAAYEPPVEIIVQHSDGDITKYQPVSFETSEHLLTMHWSDRVTIVPFTQVFAVDIIDANGSAGGAGRDGAQPPARRRAREQ